MNIGIQFKIKRWFKIISLSFLLFYVSCATPPRLTYEGERNQEGKYHGQGVVTYSNGDKWEGEYKDGLPFNGQGTNTYSNGDKYVGEWKDGNPHGQGTKTYSDGGKYVGEFKYGNPNGQSRIWNMSKGDESYDYF